MADLDIWQAAGTMIDAHGAETAAFVAARHANTLAEKGDSKGFREWTRICLAIDDLARGPCADEPVH